MKILANATGIELMAAITKKRRAQSVKDAQTIVSYNMNGRDIVSTLNAVNELPEEGRPTLLKDARIIANKVKGEGLVI